MKTLTTKKTNSKGTKKDLESIKSNNAVIPVKPNIKDKGEELKEEAKKVINPILSLQQKIEKIENLKTLIEKREKLEDSRKKLSSFVVGTNQFNENIVLTDENGNTFKTSNSEVIHKVITTINETLIEKIKEIETQIEF